MDEQKANATIRPTKKQKEMLEFIEIFIAEHGYSPSYREIQQGLRYTSVATVALHVDNLIKRGHLAKRGRSARSLEVLSLQLQEGPKIKLKQLKDSEEKWLVEKIEIFFKEAEDVPKPNQAQLDQLYVLCGALKVLGSAGAANSFMTRLSKLKKRTKQNKYVA